MATLVSPGTQITITDDSAYASAGEGTVPLIIIGTHKYKTLPDGSGVAPGTLPENSNKLYPITSQRELLQTFGSPIFYTRNGTSVHGYELNEYGLHAAYQYLGVSNRAYVICADIDYAQLMPSASAPTGELVHGTGWFDTTTNPWGFFEYDGSSWVSRDIYIIDSVADIDNSAANQVTGQKPPLNTIGLIGDFAFVVIYDQKVLYQKLATATNPASGEWFVVGGSGWASAKALAGHTGASLVYSPFKPAVAQTGSVLVMTTPNNSTSPNAKKWYIKTYNAVTGGWTEVVANVRDLANEATIPLENGIVYASYEAAQAVFAFRICDGTSWSTLSIHSGATPPVAEPEEGTLWYNPIDLQVSIKINNGTQWVPYLTMYPNTDPNGVILQGSMPSTQSDGTPLVENDMWIDTSDMENYPMIYVYRGGYWVRMDIANDVDPNYGMVFGEISKVDALNYSVGMRLFDLSASTNDVKQYVGGTWTNASGFQTNGVPFFGRKAQRQMIVRSLAATIIGNEDIRAETVYYNLIAAPGYVEMVDEMVVLNNDIKNVAFIVADTPARLKPSGEEISRWADATRSGAVSNSEEGATTYDPYVAFYYPWGLSTNVNGNEIMVPPSTIALRTIAQNDNIAYPWFAPAGFNRGLVDNASSVGYLTESGEYKAVFLNQGQRDILYTNRINPIAYIPNRGLVVYGQKTRHNLDTALDRINVSRLINYLRYNLDNITKPYLFEPNDHQTRDSIRTTIERFMANLVSLRGIYDYVVVCDTSNNTPDRIDRNELWVDIAIKPTKAIEFIYIPLRIANSGDDL